MTDHQPNPHPAETLLEHLRALERRRRVVRAVSRLGRLAGPALLVPFSLACWRLVTPVEAPVLLTVLGIWLGGLGLVVAWLLLRPHPLATVAAEVDARCDLRDELTTARHFIGSGATSPWIDLQVARAAATVSRIDPRLVYPTTMPGAARAALVGLAVTMALTLLPSGVVRSWWPWTPPPALTAADRDELRALADRLSAAGDADLVRLAAEIDALADGNIRGARLAQRLDDIRNQLDRVTAERAGLDRALAELARELGQVRSLKPAADALDQGDAGAAADRLRDLARRGTSDAERETIARALRDAAGHGSLPSLRAQLARAGDRLMQRDPTAAADALEQAAKALQAIAAEQAQQQQVAAAVQDVNRLGEQLGDRPANDFGSQEPTQNEIAQITGDWTQGSGAETPKDGAWTGQPQSPGGSGGGRPPDTSESERFGQGSSAGGDGRGGDRRTEAREVQVRLRRAELPDEVPDAPDEQQEPLVDRASPAATATVAFQTTRAPGRYDDAHVLQTEPVPADDEDLVKAYFTNLTSPQRP